MMRKLSALLLVCTLLLSCAASVGEPENMDALSAIAFAQSVIGREEIAGANGLALSVNRDDDCWVCEFTPADENAKGYVLAFDDSRRIHRFRNLSYELPDVPKTDNQWTKGISGDYQELMLKVSDVLDRLMMDTRGWGYSSTAVAAVTDEGLCLLSLDDFSEYALVKVEGDAVSVLAYGDLNASHGAYGSTITRTQAIAAARKEAEDRYGLKATDILLGQANLEVSDPERFLVNGSSSPLPYWFVVLWDGPDTESAGAYHFIIDALTGECVQSADPANAGNG